jgi:hypothetical protein
VLFDDASIFFGISEYWICDESNFKGSGFGANTMKNHQSGTNLYFALTPNSLLPVRFYFLPSLNDSEILVVARATDHLLVVLIN